MYPSLPFNKLTHKTPTVILPQAEYVPPSHAPNPKHLPFHTRNSYLKKSFHLSNISAAFYPPKF